MSTLDDLGSLEDYRAQIDEVDDRIAELVLRRLELARLACEAKRAIGLPTFDPSRERSIFRRAERAFGRDVALVVSRVVAACRDRELDRDEASVPGPDDGGGPGAPT